MTDKPLKAPFFRTPYNYDTRQASDDSAAVPVGESLTVQSCAAECDINVIMERYGLTGQLPVNLRPPQYGDYLHATDYRSALQCVMDAQENFEQLPANIRARFSNDPGEFLVFCSQEANWAEMKAMGLVVNGPPASPGASGSAISPMPGGTLPPGVTPPGAPGGAPQGGGAAPGATMTTPSGPGPTG